MRRMLSILTSAVAKGAGYAYSCTAGYESLVDFVRDFLKEIDEFINNVHIKIDSDHPHKQEIDSIVDAIKLRQIIKDIPSWNSTLETLCALHNICIIFIKSPEHITTNLLLWASDSKDPICIELVKWLNAIDSTTWVPMIRTDLDFDLAVLMLRKFGDLGEELDGFIPAIVPDRDNLIVSMSKSIQGVMGSLSSRLQKFRTENDKAKARKEISENLEKKFSQNLNECQTQEEVTCEYSGVVEALYTMLINIVYSGNQKAFAEKALAHGRDLGFTKEDHIEAVGFPDSNILGELRRIRDQRLEALKADANAKRYTM